MMMWLLRVAVIAVVAALVPAGGAGGVATAEISRAELDDFVDYLQHTSQLGQTRKGIHTEDEDDEKVSDDAWEHSGKFEGDLILSERQRRAIVKDVAEGLARNGLNDHTKRWPDNQLIYYIQREHFSSDQLQAIEDGIQDLGQVSCVKFRPWRRGDRDAVVIQGSRRGCFSQVGYQGGYQVLNLSGRHPAGRGCFRHGTVVHELLHSLGFYHMQSSPDRDDYIDVHWDNIHQPARHNFRKYNSFSVSNFGVPYDYDSVLHYNRKAFSRNGRDTIVPKQAGVEIGQRRGLSDKDVEKLNKMYCNSASNNAEAVEDTTEKNISKKKVPKNRPFQGTGIGYHQGKTIVIKLPAAKTFNIVKIPSVPFNHIFGYVRRGQANHNHKPDFKENTVPMQQLYKENANTKTTEGDVLIERNYNEHRQLVTTTESEPINDIFYKDEYSKVTDKKRSEESYSAEVVDSKIQSKIDSKEDKNEPKHIRYNIDKDEYSNVTDKKQSEEQSSAEVIDSEIQKKDNREENNSFENSKPIDHSHSFSPEVFDDIKKLVQDQKISLHYYPESKINKEYNNNNEPENENDSEIDFKDKEGKLTDFANSKKFIESLRYGNWNDKNKSKNILPLSSQDEFPSFKQKYGVSLPWKAPHYKSYENVQKSTPEYGSIQNLENKNDFSYLYKQVNHDGNGSSDEEKHKLFGKPVPSDSIWYTKEYKSRLPQDNGSDRNKESENIKKKEDRSTASDESDGGEVEHRSDSSERNEYEENENKSNSKVFINPIESEEDQSDNSSRSNESVEKLAYRIHDEYDITKSPFEQNNSFRDVPKYS